MPEFLQPIIVWGIKALGSWIIGKMVSWVGHTETAKHVEEQIIKHTPLPDDPNPPPWVGRKPKQDWLK